MSLSTNDRSYLRDLASQVAAIAAEPIHEERRRMWRNHNDLKPERPMVLVSPEGSWEELLPQSEMSIEETFWRGCEWWLRHVLYRAEHLRDDNPIEPIIEIAPHRAVVGWGMDVRMKATTTARGAAAYDPVLNDPADYTKLTQPHLIVDHDEKRRTWDAMQDVFGDILTPRWKRSPGVNTSLVNLLCYWRGLENVMLDMIERPDWLHEVFSFMVDATHVLLDELESSGDLEVMDSNDYAGSGGVCYTNELPAPDYSGTPRCIDTWGFAESQEYTLVSAKMYEEFGLRYQAPLLERFGLNCYGCCEDVTDKLDLILDMVPRLRRLSISPWTDIEVAAEKLEDRCIFSWKPNPTCVVDPYDADRTRLEIRDTLEKTRGCVMEMILKDTHTCGHKPERMSEWVRIASEECDRFASQN
jgi:hypothetical protein